MSVPVVHAGAVDDGRMPLSSFLRGIEESVRVAVPKFDQTSVCEDGGLMDALPVDVGVSICMAWSDRC